ncbi:hypothetical protein C9J12_20640 [Photobacterium frigidiphilum]|uniref:DUF1353 domain-containing protein n=2 Tax=Photobacterium frigidiphilum TaxID=264736 RepID=A0A2T3JAM8_9GAMM|nr:hypothetical protein C9J12_20640 [Photobacterium frigidiphilum]
MENWQYTINEETIVIPKGFVFDGASIPRPLWGILSPTGLLLVPGLIHDFGYRYDYLWAIDHDATDHNAGAGKSYKKIHDKAGQAHWDQIFYSVGTEVNGMTTLNFLAWLALATMGRFSWDKHRNKNYGDVVPE